MLLHLGFSHTEENGFCDKGSWRTGLGRSHPTPVPGRRQSGLFSQSSVITDPQASHSRSFLHQNLLRCQISAAIPPHWSLLATAGTESPLFPPFSSFFIQPFLLQTKQTPAAVSPRLFPGSAVVLLAAPWLVHGCAQSWAGSSVSVPGAHTISMGISWSGINSSLVLTPGPAHLLLKWASVWGGPARGVGVLWDLSLLALGAASVRE